MRTPHSAVGRVSRTASPHLAAIVPQMLDTAVAAGYIVVYQDVRGKFGSEGDYVLTRPLRGPLNPTEVDHATDCYDTLEFIHFQETARAGDPDWWRGEHDAYDTFLRTGSAGAVAASRGLEQLGFWQGVMWAFETEKQAPPSATRSRLAIVAGALLLLVVVGAALGLRLCSDQPGPLHGSRSRHRNLRAPDFVDWSEGCGPERRRRDGPIRIRHAAGRALPASARNRVRGR
jgi:hypothetical protein